MKKFVSLFIVLVLATASAWADDGLWVERQNGSKQGFLFADKPVITYTADNLVMTTAKATAEFPIADIKQITFADDVVNAIGQVRLADGTEQLIRVTAEGAQLSGFAPNTAVALYDAAGRTVAKYKTATDGTLSVNLSAQHNETYSINNSSRIGNDSRHAGARNTKVYGR